MPKTLLLADDSVVIQKLVGLSFANENIKIVATDNGDDAISKARAVVPDVVLADVVMPGKSGYEVCEAIKQDPQLAHIPVLLLTGTFEAFDEARAARVGADGQITKPFEAQALVERVGHFMNRPAPEPTVVSSSHTSGNTSGKATEIAAEVAAEDDDLFDPNVTTLSPLDAPPVIDTAPSSRRGATTDSTPVYSEDSSASILFGAPGEAATDELDVVGGGLALGQAVSPGDDFEEVEDDAFSGDATMAILDDDNGFDSDAGDDSFDDFDDDLGLDDPLALSNSLAASMSASAEDLDSALDAGSEDGEPTILVSRDGVNAKTSPNLETEREATSFRDGLTIHAPSAPIDADVAEAFSPAARFPAAGEATVVANLDSRLEESVPDPGETRDALGTRNPGATPLDLGPSSLDSADLDFGFDVSEQAPPGSWDVREDSFSSLMDISASALLGRQDLDTDDDSSDAIHEDDALVGYDVSSSDLATATLPPSAPRSSGVEISDPIPAPASVLTPPPLPPQYLRDVASAQAFEADEPSPAEESISARAHDIAVGVFGTAVELDENEDVGEAPAPPPLDSDPDAKRITDLSPMMEQRIQETLEKVAWEAFSDLSEAIVKQVMTRVEQIAWEVIPQMAETLVREEIRRMKGEDD